MNDSLRLKKLYFFIATIALSILFCKEKPAGKQNTMQKMQDNRPAILFLGDSLTAGFGLAVNESYPALFQQKLNKENIKLQVINGGRSGDSTAGGLERLAWYLNSDIEIQHAVIALGSNDAMRGTDLTETKNNLHKIVKQLKRNTSAKIYLIEFMTFPNLGSKYGREFRDIFKKVAQQEKIIPLPFFLQNVAGNADLNQQDGIHPNAEGTKIVAENIYQSLRKYLKGP